MNELTAIFQDATAAIEAPYYRLNIDGGDPVFRERVYCYELYHQMRCRWPPNTDYKINGEIDKAAHPILARLGADRLKPDFLVHRPGYMVGNYAIFEIKTVNMTRDGIKKDLETLSLFIARVGYQRAIYCIFGDSAERRLPMIREVAHTVNDLSTIEVWLHSECGRAAEPVDTLQP